MFPMARWMFRSIESSLVLGLSVDSVPVSFNNALRRSVFAYVQKHECQPLD
ncbi:hypothetical protein Pla22_36330 [Rubripirellula amarantea]|uniref:Uncharacterized protein n=1 Tax=Rubripirellula amarantea TaxID=2527999 RepID=A0A5C5WJR4_9BACT|nr:hypothetical protein Pla22_36330 [Rubripirellula amarantea]